MYTRYTFDDEIELLTRTAGGGVLSHTHTYAQTHTYRLSIVVVRVWFIVRVRPFETPTRTTARTRNNRR